MKREFTVLAGAVVACLWILAVTARGGPVFHDVSYRISLDASGVTTPSNCIASGRPLPFRTLLGPASGELLGLPAGDSVLIDREE